MTVRTVHLVIAAFCLVGTLAASAQEDAEQSILITNVRLVDAVGENREVGYNVVVRDEVLDLITEDPVDPADFDIAVSAQNGYLMGSTDLGQVASFLILSADPRDDPQVLLDTARYARFALVEGRIIRNDLPTAVPGMPQADRVTRWLSYNPPPLAVPSSYDDTSKWNRWDTRWFSGIFTAAVILDRQRWFGQDEASELQVGDLAEFDRGEIRGLRFGAVGTLNFERPWVYTFFAATNAFDKGFDTDETNDLTIFDYRVDIPIAAEGTLSVGKQKEPISMERLMSMVWLPMQERTVASDALMPSRNVGVVYNGTLADQRMTYAVGLFNDWFDAGESLSESATQVVGRVTGLPFAHQSEGSLVHVGFGWRWSNARQGLRYVSEPEFNSSPAFVDTDLFDADNAFTYDFEVSARRGPIWIHSEFVGTVASAADAGDPHFFGYHVTGSWVITGEMRGYNRRSGIFQRVPVARGLNRNGWGAWEAAVRWSSLDLNKGAIEGGKNEVLSLGLNWWPSWVANVNANYRYITLDRYGVKGHSHGINFRLLLILE